MNFTLLPTLATTHERLRTQENFTAGFTAMVSQTNAVGRTSEHSTQKGSSIACKEIFSFETLNAHLLHKNFYFLHDYSPPMDGKNSGSPFLSF